MPPEELLLFSIQEALT